MLRPASRTCSEAGPLGADPPRLPAANGWETASFFLQLLDSPDPPINLNIAAGRAALRSVKA